MSPSPPRAAALAATLALAACGNGGDAPVPAELHASTLTLDSHVDIPFDFATPSVDPLTAPLQANLENMQLGGLDAAFFIVYVGQGERSEQGYDSAREGALTKFDAIRRMTSELYPDLIGLARSADDVERLVGEGKLAAAIGIENGYVIGQDLSLLDRYHELGARYMTLVHNGHNDIADSAQPNPELGDGEAEHGGVSAFGERVIERLNALGIMVDISHASKASALDAIRLSHAPVIASHSSVHALAAHPRNLDDETLLALRDNGGVVQIVAFDAYLKHDPEAAAADAELRERFGVTSPQDIAALPAPERAEFMRAVEAIQERRPPSTVSDLVDHIDYAARLIGIDHVGISSDFGGGGGVIGWTNAAETDAVTSELAARGYTPEEIEKLWSGNLLRVWREAENLAAAAR